MLGVLIRLAQDIVHLMCERAVPSVCVGMLSICFITRIFTGLRYSSLARNRVRNGDAVNVVPYWIPWLGHTLPFFTNSHKWLSRLNLNANRGIVTIIVGGKRCHVIMSPALVKDVLSVKAPVDNHDMVGYFMKNVWDDKGIIGSMDATIIWGKIHRAMYQLNREPFLSRAGDMVTSNIETTIFALVSPSTCAQNREKSANVSRSLAHKFDAEASFFPLIRHYVADLVLPALLGTAFMRNYPNCAHDLFAFDKKFHLFLMGLPSWTPFSNMRESANARTRLKAALADLHSALAAKSQGKAPPGGFNGRWADLGDVSTVMIDRVRLWEETGVSCEAYAATHAFLVWVTLINANVIIFWLLFHIYSDPVLLADIRQDISPFTTVKRSTNLGDAPEFKLDSRRIREGAPILQSALLETMRLYTHSNSFKTVKMDFTVITPRLDDPQGVGKVDYSNKKEQPASWGSSETYKLRKGDMICVPFGLHQTDPKYWDDARAFNAQRFIVQERNLDSNSTRRFTEPSPKVSVDFTRINPWGVGASVCKGQKFSHREVMEIVVAILTCWDIKPADSETGWRDLGLMMAGGTAVPKDDFRVKLNRTNKNI